MYLLFYTKRKIIKGFAGITLGFIIIINEDYKNDKCLLEHEKVHVKQFWNNPLFCMLYLISKKYRLKSEVEAYKKQIECGANPDRMAQFLCEKYNLNITFDEAKKLLST
jgi:hypothetical protein